MFAGIRFRRSLPPPCDGASFNGRNQVPPPGLGKQRERSKPELVRVFLAPRRQGNPPNGLSHRAAVRRKRQFLQRGVHFPAVARRETATPRTPPYGLRHLLQRGEPPQRSGLPQRTGLGMRTKTGERVKGKNFSLISQNRYKL